MQRSAGCSTGHLQLQRKVGRIALEHAIADLALRILDQQSALRTLEEHDHAAMTTIASTMIAQNQAGRQGAGAAEFQCLPAMAVREPRNDAGKDD